MQWRQKPNPKPWIGYWIWWANISEFITFLGLWFCPGCQPNTNDKSEQEDTAEELQAPVFNHSNIEVTEQSEAIKIKYLEDELNKTKIALAEANLKVQEFLKGLSRLNETLPEEIHDSSDYKIEVTEDLDAIKIKDLEDELKRTKRDLVESNSKTKESEEENKNFKGQLADAKCEIEKLKKGKSELQIEADGNKKQIDEMKESNAKDRTFKDKLAINVFNANLGKATHEELGSLLKLDLEELYSKSNEDKGGLISEDISNLVVTYKFFKQNHSRLDWKVKDSDFAHFCLAQHN